MMDSYLFNKMNNKKSNKYLHNKVINKINHNILKIR